MAAAPRDADGVIIPATHVYLARYEGELVLLDLATDTYHALSPAASRSVTEVLGHGYGDLSELDARLLKPLFAARLLIECDDGACVDEIPEPPERGGLADRTWRPHQSVLLGTNPTPERGDVLRAVGLLWRTHQLLRRNGMSDLIDSLRRRAICNDPQGWDAERVGELVEAHIRARMIYPRRIECLVGSAALAVHLWAEGKATRFVIGVQKYPFHAHAWLQHGDTVLNDAPGPQARLAPIPTIV